MRRAAGLLALALVSAAPPAQDGAGRLLDVLVARHAREGDPSDVRSTAARLGFDRAKIAAFVREKIGFEPYYGILRDAPGTLLAGRGNPLDRALLLAALLEAGGEKTRLMLGETNEVAPGPVDLSLPPADLKALAAELGADEADVRAVVEEARREDERLVAEAVEAGRARGPALLARVELAAAPPSRPVETSWVQVWDPAKKDWEDVDAPKAGNPRPWTAAQLADQRRSLTVRLVLRRKAGDRIERLPILQVPLDAAAAAWKPIELSVSPAEGQFPNGGKLRAMAPAERVEALKKVRKFRPGLLVDGKAYGGQPFDLDGKVYEVTPDGRTGPARELGRALGGVFGGLGGEEEKPAGAIAGLDLEIAVKEPREPEQVHRRALLAPAGEARALPFLQWSLLVDGAPLRPGDRGRRELAALARNARAFRALLAGDPKGPRLNPHAEVDALLLRFVDLRRRAIVALAAGKGVVQDALGLTASSRQLFLDEAAGAVFERRGIDLIENPAWIAGDPAATAALGVADTALEALLLSRRFPGSTSTSAWTLLERERLLRGEPQVLRSDARSRVRWSDAAWWSVEPGRGRVVGRVASGGGQGMVEYAWEQASNICAYTDAASVLTMSPDSPQAAKDANDLYGNFCSVIGGSTVRDQMKAKIDKMTADMWAGATQALGGL
jgi:hypothetical protein